MQEPIDLKIHKNCSNLTNVLKLPVGNILNIEYNLWLNHGLCDVIVN